MKTLHARLSPSGASAWMECVGKLAMEDGLPAETNEYSDEGTAAHALASMCLTEDKHPAAYIGRVLRIVNGVYWSGEGEKPARLFGHENDKEDIERVFPVDVAMAGHVNVYVQNVLKYRDADGVGGTMHVEVSLPVGHITGEDGATGTGDVVNITADHEEIQAHDLKFGMGVKVFAKRNAQLMLYCLGAIAKYPGLYKRVRLVIHQPRLSAVPDEWSCGIEELNEFAGEVRARAQDAMRALEFKDNWMGKDLSYLVPGDACTFCRAQATCPGLAKYVQDTVGAAFPVLDATDTPAALVPTDLATLGLKNRCVDLIQDWCKAVRAKVEAALYEHDNDEAAQKALGHKLVMGRKGSRVWKDETEAEIVLKKFRLKDNQIYNKKLISPVQAVDVVLKGQEKRLKKVIPLITQAEGKASVAPLEDKRPAIVIKPVADAFAVAAPDGSDLV